MWHDLSTDEKKEFIRKHATEMSAAAMAKAVGGCTRNSIIGFAHRNKIPLGTPVTAAARRVRNEREARKGGADVPPRAPRKPRQTKPKAPPPPPPPKVEIPEVIPEPVVVEIIKQAEPGSKGITLLKLTDSTCKWPIGDPLEKDFHFCGLKSLDSGPYCESHSRAAYLQVERRNARR